MWEPLVRLADHYSVPRTDSEAVALVDTDRIETTNLTRQYLFTESDVGALRCEVLSHALLSRNSTIPVRTVEREIRDRSDLDALPLVDTYFDRYRGYLSSHDHVRADGTELAALAKHIREENR